ncbi:CocE/NonD family hydrolase [Rhodococcus hoagii]|nr:CocE/NonD family hydrolase [Prescottella equi]
MGRARMRWISRTLAAIAVAAIATVGTVAPASATPDAGELGAQWTATADGPAAYPGMDIAWDVPIRMSDGVILKANVYRPADADGRPVDTPFPTIVSMTPYTKLVSALAEAAVSAPGISDAVMDFARDINFSGTPLSGITDLTRALSGGGLRTFTVDRELIRSGYTQVVVDVRGTGFSQGIWQVFQEREQQDTIETIEWAAQQAWSNGRIGMSGVSYSAINQIQAASKRPAALQAIVPIEPGGDLVRDVVAPGGGAGVGFLPFWLAAVNGLKLIPDVQALMQGNLDQTWLRDRIADPATFFQYLIQAITIPDVDSIPPELQTLLEPDSSLRLAWLPHAEQITAPTLLYGGWHDIFTNSQPRLYNAIPLAPGKKQLIMGDTYHLNPGSGFGDPGYPPRLDVLQRAWFDRWLKDIDNGIETYGPVTSYQQGNDWTTTDRFPRAGVEHRRMYLAAQPSGTTATSVHDGSLLASPPSGTTTLTVAPGLSSLCSRDAAQELAGLLAVIDGCAKDNRIAERDALTFTSAPVAAPTQISGPVNVHLNTVLDTTDGYWTATLDDVAPDGTSTVLTSGQLTSSLRGIDEGRSERSANGDLTDPFYTLTLAARQPIVPGRPTTLDVGLTATDALLQPGHRLRVSVAASNFPKGMLLRPLLNESRLAPQHLVLDPASPSFVNVPLDVPIP